MFAALAALVCAIVAYYGSNALSRWQHRKLPGPRPAWLLGNLLQLGEQGLTLQRWAQQFGPLFVFYLGRQPNVVVSGGGEQMAALPGPGAGARRDAAGRGSDSSGPAGTGQWQLARPQAALPACGPQFPTHLGPRALACQARPVHSSTQSSKHAHERTRIPTLSIPRGPVRFVPLPLLRAADPDLIRAAGVKQFASFHDRRIFLRVGGPEEVALEEAGMVLARCALDSLQIPS